MKLATKLTPYGACLHFNLILVKYRLYSPCLFFACKALAYHREEDNPSCNTSAFSQCDEIIN